MPLWYEDSCFGKNVAKSCFRLYDKLGRKGKPQKGKEWTLLAAVVQVHQQGINTTINNELEIIRLAQTDNSEINTSFQVQIFVMIENF